MSSIKELIQSIEAADSSFDEKLSAINKMEETLVAMRQQEEQAVQDNVDLIVEAIKVMENKVTAQLEVAKSIVPEKGDKGDKGERGLDGRQGIDGKNGLDGRDGKDGIDGKDGVSVTDAKIDFDGSLVISLSTGQEINVGEVVAPDLAEKIKVISTMSTNGAVGIKDEGTSITSGVKTINFVGATVTATNSGDDVTVNVSAGTGTVTSVAATAGTGISVTGSPITTTGTLTITNTAPDQTVSLTGAGTTSISGTYPNFTVTSNDSTLGTVTSVAATAGTGISITGSPITSSGTLNITNTAPDQTVVLTASTGISTSGTYPNFTITNSAPDQTVSLTASTGISTSGTYPNFTITNSAPDQTVALTAGTGISTSGTYPNFTITNSAPDQIVALTGAGTTSITGTYPNFTITSNDSATGTVTSVAALTLGTTGTDLSSTVANGTTTPVITLNVPTASATNRGALSSADWTTFNNKGSGTVTSVTATSPVASTGGTTPVISMPAATTSVSGYLTSTDWTTFNGKGSGTVTSVGGTGTVNGITLTGTVTSSGNLTLGGTLANVDLATQVTGNLPVTNLGSGTSASATTFWRGDGTWATPSGGSGTVTSVAATVPSFLSVSGSPITTTGTLAITLSGTALPIANGGTGATTLAGASIATYTGTETLTNKRIDPRVTSAASASSLTPDISASDVYAYTALAAGLTINAPTGTPVDGDKLIFRLLDNGTSRALTWNATYTVIGVTLPTATTISKTTYVGCIYNANNTRWDVIAVTTQA